MNRYSNILLHASFLAVAALVMSGCSKLPVPADAPTATIPAGGNIADSDITMNVRTALGQDPVLKGFDIGVVTLKGDVRLTGVLNEQTQIDEAVKMARSAAGAHSVHDELTLKK
jgi:hyperosmotically inducible protein